MNQSERTIHNSKAVLNKLSAATTTNTGNKRICFTVKEFEAITAHLNAIIEIAEKPKKIVDFIKA
jgi:hypothetical protein